MRILASGICVLLVLGAVACGGGDDLPPGTAASTTSAAAPDPAVEAEPAEPDPAVEAEPAEPEPAEAAGAVTASSEPPRAPEAGTPETPETPETPDASPPAPEVPAAPDAALTELAGRWDGAISIPGSTDLPFAVDMTVSDGELRGTIDIQGISDLPLVNVTLDEGLLHFELNSPVGLAVWDGQVRDGVIEGDFAQAGMTMGFWMQRFEDPAGGDGDGGSFRGEDVVFANGEITLVGELTLPAGDGPHPAAVLISGSGDQDRDSEVVGFRLFAVLADHLAGAGVASLRFDDRGVGGSTGDGLLATLQDRAGDVEAAFDLLRSRDDIASGGIGLVGHSEGGIVASVVAGRTDVAFVALLAAPAVTPQETLEGQQRALLEDSGASAEEVEQFEALQELVFSAVATGQGWAEAEEAARASVLRGIEEFPDQWREAIPDEDAYVEGVVAEQLATWQSPWFESFLLHDPKPEIVALDVPVIALFGELDVQVPAATNATAMSEAIATSSVPSYTIATILSANHLFQEAVTGSVTEYARLKREFAPEFVDILTDWLTEVAHPQP